MSVTICVHVSQLPKSNGVVSAPLADSRAMNPYAWSSAIGTVR